jgi:hypothetical protein
MRQAQQLNMAPSIKRRGIVGAEVTRSVVYLPEAWMCGVVRA